MQKYPMRNKTLELCCYICGAGAFGVFFRWLQDQMAFNEQGLADRSALHVLVPMYLIIVAIVFIRMVDKMRNQRFFLPTEINEALHHEGKLFSIVRWAAGVIMILGGLLVFATCEVETEASMLRILSLLAVLSGISYPLLLAEATSEAPRPRRLCWFAVMPVLLFAFWLVTSYKINSINSIVWAYAIEIIALVIAMLAFFRMAGFAFGAPNTWRCLFLSMYGGSICIMAIADSRNIGLQLILLGAAVMLVLYNWIMLQNVQRKDAPIRYQPSDGFERL